MQSMPNDEGDFFGPLRAFAALLQKRGLDHDEVGVCRNSRV